MRDYFNVQHQTQQQQFKILDDLSKDQVLLQSFLLNKQNNALRLEGVGLFYNEADFSMNQHTDRSVQARYLSPTVIALNNEIKKIYGRDFLSQRAAKLIPQIKSLHPTQWQEYLQTVSEDHYPPMVYSFANRYSDLITAMLTIQVIENGLALRSDAYIVASDQVFKLTDKELTALGLYRNQLKEGLIQLVNSNRPDWGYAVLVNTARLIAVDMSIKQGQLIFIDTHESRAEFNEEIGLAKYAVQIQRHLKDTHTSLLNTKSLLTQNKAFTEMNYSLLEMQANRYIELSKAISGKQAIRFYGANLVPTKSITLPLPVVPDLPKATIKRAIQQLSVFQEQHQTALKKSYAYNLITRNCVTELFRLIDRAFIQQAEDSTNTMPLLKEESNQRLGGYVDTTRVNFIPVTSHYAVRNNYKINKQMLLPSFRLMKLNESYAKENDLLVYLRENNTVTSTLYKRNPDDSFFIFFTDNELLLRPVYGAVNTLAGLGQSLLGLFTWTYDSGEMLSSGASGVLMSLPELLFVNMRKGSFRYLPYSHLSAAELTLSVR